MIIFSWRPYLNLQGALCALAVLTELAQKTCERPDSGASCKSPYNFSEQNIFPHKCWDGLLYFGAIGQARNPNHRALVGHVSETWLALLNAASQYKFLMVTEKKIYYQFIATYQVMSLSGSFVWAGTLSFYFICSDFFCCSSLRTCSSWKQLSHCAGPAQYFTRASSPFLSFSFELNVLLMLQ